MLHKELGAYLVALGTLMIQKNKSAKEIAQNVHSDIDVQVIMMENGIDGLDARIIARTQDRIVQGLNIKTFASNAERTQYEAKSGHQDRFLTDRS